VRRVACAPTPPPLRGGGAPAGQQGIAVEMLIYNRFSPADPLIERETAEYLQRYLRQHFPQTAFEYMDGQNP